MSNNASIYETLRAQKELIDANPALVSLRQDLFRVMRNERDRLNRVSHKTPAEFEKETIDPVVRAHYDALQREIIELAIAQEKEGK